MKKVARASTHADANVNTPTMRRLRGYAFDPNLSIQLATAVVNEIVLTVPWEKTLAPGPQSSEVSVVGLCVWQSSDMSIFPAPACNATSRLFRVERLAARFANQPQSAG